MNQSEDREAGSFRDPSGFLFYRHGILYRQVNQTYKEDYNKLISSGLYEQLVDTCLLIPHEEVDCTPFNPEYSYRILKPQFVTFISYPFEWCFSQLKNAALTTLTIQKLAMEHGMILKDASVYNIQFVNCKPVLIDTLSFTEYEEGRPWIAYRQFCQHFLAPLALMSYCDHRLGQLLRVHLDGVPLDLTSKLLPKRSKLSFAIAANIHLHAKSQNCYAKAGILPTYKKMSKKALSGLVENLLTAVNKLRWQPGKSVWEKYYEETNYDEKAFEHKKEIVNQYLDITSPGVVWDLGANTGVFSRIAADKGIDTISFDYDMVVVEQNYLKMQKEGRTNILPLVLDLTNPSPGLGWDHVERKSLLQRAPADTILALALVHHLAIGNNLPFERIADFMHKACRNLIVEFVPKSDSQVRRLLSTRDDIFSDYSQTKFEQSFSMYYAIVKVDKIKHSERLLYLMKER